ncbi:MAG: hypothetical protein Q8S71_00525 [Hydrogenophaga sp.]|nr:hypothetical protein [Hydrogenophaga sp.]
MSQIVSAAVSCSSLGDAKKRLECYDSSSKKTPTKMKVNQDESEAQKSVLKVLKDPDSAKFGQFTLIKNEVACLTVNSKNSMGGYVGDREAVLIKTQDTFSFVDFVNEKADHEQCVLAMSKKNEKPDTESKQQDTSSSSN